MVVSIIILGILWAIYMLLVKGFLWKLIVLICAWLFMYSFISTYSNNDLFTIGLPTLICLLATIFTKEE